jgi:hypothetical protein
VASYAGPRSLGISAPGFINVGRIELSGLLSPLPIREDHHVVLSDVTPRSPIPPTVDDPWAAPNTIGVPVAIVPEADVVDASGHVCHL